MKLRFFTPALVGLLAIALTACASTGSAGVESGPKSLLVAKTASEVPVDGNGTGWPDAKATTISQRGISATIKLAYSNTDLYVYAAVVGAPPTNTQTDGNIYNGNNLEVCLGLDPKAAVNRVAYGPLDFQFGVSPGNGEANPPSVWIWSAAQKAAVGAVAKVIKTDKGYQLEAKIPWSNFGSFIPVSGTKITGELALDVSHSSSRDSQIIWSGTKDFWKDPSNWGPVVFE